MSVTAYANVSQDRTLGQYIRVPLLAHILL
jgi:hypothetical protein